METFFKNNYFIDENNFIIQQIDGMSQFYWFYLETTNPLYQDYLDWVAEGNIPISITGVPEEGV